ncbi:MAG TPA: prepilin peptidase [Candidatus Paceibacterota bacterium]
MNYLIAGLFGLCIGSFLNVVIFRLNTGRSIGGRSRCLSCSHILSPIDLVPVLSYLCFRGRCRYCKARINIQYPVVELSTAIVFVLIVWRFPELSLFGLLVLTAMCADLIAILVYDLRHKIIPDQLVYAFIVLAMLGHYSIAGTIFTWAGPALFALFALIWLVSRGKWMGFGDAKLVLGIGFLLGPEIAFTAMLLAFWSGAIVGIIGLLVKRSSLTMKSEIPFAPFLILATLWQLFFPIYFNLIL